ncbi:MAG TPA: hypothetical protein VE967_19915 [Gemmatimonadaceae bacterium]|nr:hypothetical protein [Gemmatimonadaceae bacterium]
MSPSLISRTTQADALKAGLDAGAHRVRAIAGRIAQGSASQTFKVNGAQSADPSQAQQAEPVDLEQDMASLANEQLRFEATAKLLEKTYAAFRASIREK